MEKISILGAGSWGSVLAGLLSENGHAVTLWDYNPEVLKYLSTNLSHMNIKELKLKANQIEFEYDLEKAISGSKYLITAIPAQTYKEFWKKIRKNIGLNVKIINVSKGIDIETNKFISQLLADFIPEYPIDNFIALSGPSYAIEVVKKNPTAVVASSYSLSSAEEVQKIFCNSWFRVYTNTDVVGVELAGAVKNVIAIASGISHGIGYGVNTAAALITRGNKEIIRLGLALGAEETTFYGLAGIGDLILTATSELSRNFSFGLLLGQGFSFNEAKSKISTVIEGIETVKSTWALSKTYRVEMPIIEKVYKVLFEGVPPKEAVNQLMLRELKSEY
ncbi:MAG: Glycerol-3-phosphate dehydrogenase [uncultured bacterium]|nr:MAG: Glycerol-3-phosphate dehydrogenase [uncultured bacterium]